MTVLLAGTTPDREAGDARTVLDRIPSRRLTRFVGRAAEMALLTQALGQAAQRLGQVVAVVGEPGVGKSRLIRELADWSRTSGWEVLGCGALSPGRGAPYRPIVDVLERHFGIEDTDGPGEVAERIAARLAGLDPGLRPLLPAVSALLDLPIDHARWQMLDPPQRGPRTVEAVTRLLVRESQVQPLLLVFEDLEWLDREAKACLDHLVDALSAARILLLVSGTPEHAPGWSHRGHYRELRLEPLSPADVTELLDTRLGGDEALAPLKQALAVRSRGNPLFLEESIRALADTRALDPGAAGHRGEPGLDAGELPATIRELLARRIDRLPLEERRLLQAAAVIGPDVPHAALKEVAELPDAALRRGLEDLERRELLHEARRLPRLEYAFPHPLTREAAYASLTLEGRRALHARALLAMERLYARRLLGRVELLADHAFAGGVWDKASRYCRRAAHKAYERSANQPAVRYLEQAAVALEALGEDRETTAQAIEVRIDLRGPLTALGQFRRLLADLEEADRLAAAIGSRSQAGRVAAYLSQFFLLVGEPDRALELGRRALAVAEETGSVDVAIVANSCLGDGYFSRGDYPQAIVYHGRNVALLEGARARERFGLTGLPAVFARTWLACALAELGDFDGGARWGEEALHLAEEAGHPYSEIVADFGTAFLYLRRGQLADAVHLLQFGLGLCRTSDIRILFPVTAALLGFADTLGGRAAEGAALLERALDAYHALPMALGRSLVVGLAAEAHLLAGQPERALPLALQSLDLARAQKEESWEAWSLRLLGEIHARTDRAEPARAVGYLSTALTLATALGLRPLLAHCHVGLGLLSRRDRRSEVGEGHLATGMAMYREMNMLFWRERAEAEM